MNIAIIPARSGSKRIKNKNIKLFKNKPIISYAIKTCINSKIFDKIYVSTDSEKIAKIAKKNGADIIIREKKYLSNNHTPVTEVIKNDIEILKKKQINIGNCCCVFPTTPLLTASDLRHSYKLFKKKKKFVIFSVKKFPHPIQRAFIRNNKNGLLKMIKKKNFFKRSQDLEPTFHDAGQFYWANKKQWKKNNFFTNYSYPYFLKNFLAHDIDDINDWKYCEYLYQYRKKI